MPMTRSVRWLFSVLALTSVLVTGLGSAVAAPAPRHVITGSVIHWTPNPLSVTLTPGSSISATAWFTSTTSFSNANVHVVSMGWPVYVNALPISTTVNAGVPVSVSLYISLAPDAAMSHYTAAIAVTSGGVLQASSLPIIINNASSSPAVTWSVNPLKASLVPGTSLTANVVLTSSQTIMNAAAQILHMGWPLTMQVGKLPTVISAGKAVTLGIGITLAPDAQVGIFLAQVGVVVMGKALPAALAIQVTNAESSAKITWTPSIITGTISAGQTITVSASFTSSVQLTQAMLVPMNSTSVFQVTTSSLPPSIAAKAVVHVYLYFTLHGAGSGVYKGSIYVMAGGAKLNNALPYAITVAK